MSQSSMSKEALKTVVVSTVLASTLPLHCSKATEADRVHQENLVRKINLSLCASQGKGGKFAYKNGEGQGNRRWEKKKKRMPC